jgi:ATP synthase H subunit
VSFLIDKIILEVKKTEYAADKIINAANDKAEIIIDNAHQESDKLIEKLKEEAKTEGKLIIEKEEKYAGLEANNIIKESRRAKEELSKKTLIKINEAVKIVIQKVVEGK